MSKGKGGIIGGIITLVIGGTAFTVSQADIAENFSKDTGMSQEAAEQYVENIDEDDLVAWDEIGSDLISEGQDSISVASEIDCVNYVYEWETETLSCEKGKSQFRTIGNSEIALGKAYRVLSTESASTEDISLVIELIGKLNVSYSLEIINQIYGFPEMNEVKKANSYNKALLQATLDSD